MVSLYSTIKMMHGPINIRLTALIFTKTLSTRWILVGSFCTELIKMAQKVENISKYHYTPFSKLWHLLRRFSLKSQLFKEILCKTSVPNLPKSVTKLASAGRNSFTPRRKVWLSLGRYLWNASLVDNLLQRIHIPTFMRILQRFIRWC